MLLGYAWEHFSYHKDKILGSSAEDMSHVFPKLIAQLIHADPADCAVAVEDKSSIERLLATHTEWISDTAIREGCAHRLPPNPKLNMAVQRHRNTVPR